MELSRLRHCCCASLFGINFYIATSIFGIDRFVLSYVRDVWDRCIFNSGYTGHKGTCLFQRCWSLCKSLPRITRYSNSVLVWTIPLAALLFNKLNSVYQIRLKATRKRLIHSNSQKIFTASRQNFLRQVAKNSRQVAKKLWNWPSLQGHHSMQSCRLGQAL